MWQFNSAPHLLLGSLAIICGWTTALDFYLPYLIMYFYVQIYTWWMPWIGMVYSARLQGYLDGQQELLRV